MTILMRSLLLSILCVALLMAQQKMTIPQLRDFLKSSVQLHQPDKQVAQFLKGVTLTNKLDEDSYSALITLGLGDRTVEALRVLYDGSRNLPPAPATPVVAAAKTIPAPTPEAQSKLIEATREYANNYTKSLPNFICTQVTRRFEDPSGLEFWSRLDQVVAQLTFFEQKEDYKVKLVDNQVINDGNMDQVGGVTSTGEFGTMLKEIFDPASKTEFQWLRWATLGGRRTHVIAYSVPLAKFSIGYQSQSGWLTENTRYKGLIYVERDSGVVLRIVQEAEGISPSFPIQAVSRTLDYDLIDIAGSKHMLPAKFTTRSRTGKTLNKNEVEFRSYRRYGTESSIVFDTDDIEKETPERSETPIN